VNVKFLLQIGQPVTGSSGLIATLAAFLLQILSERKLHLYKFSQYLSTRDRLGLEWGFGSRLFTIFVFDLLIYREKNQIYKKQI
jgi:hypothetical protein